MSQTIPCLLCGSHASDVVESITGRELLILWNTFDRQVTEDDLRRCQCADTVERFCCRDCGFSYFSPTQAGDGGFYQNLSLEDAAYYNEHRPEFDHAIRWARQSNADNVLDIGCGSGNFLDLAGKAGIETFGIELNEKAAAAARAKGHQLFPCLLDSSFATEHEGRFDMVTLFQVVEHLQDPVSLLKLAACLLKPGGTLFFSVPNNGGLYRLFTLDPHQWPPHHITRWRTKDFPLLAKRVGMRHVETSGDILHGSSILTSHQFNQKARRVLGRPCSTLSNIAITALSTTYRALRLKRWVRNLGLSIYCVMVRQD
jgi:SAM-dependent methyltransferase